MNLLVVSEKHGLLIIAVNQELFVYKLDPVSFTITNKQKYKRISLSNDDVK